MKFDYNYLPSFEEVRKHIQECERHHYLGYEGIHWADVQWLCRRHHKDIHFPDRHT
jgi:hypothetical protein